MLFKKLYVLWRKNIFNESDNNLYECDNIGSGLGVYSGSNIIPPTTTFEFKSIKAGTNVNLTSDLINY